MSIQILGIQFNELSIEQFFCNFKNEKGLLTVPSGPGLATLKTEKEYYNSLLNSDFVIADSGYMVLIWNIISKQKIRKLSGLAFINHFLTNFSKMDESLFLINPSEQHSKNNVALLKKHNIFVSDEYLYTAPYYFSNIRDEILLSILEQKKPQWILINLGGGVQEILGNYLKENLSYKPAIICTGAAIAFKTGDQVKMPIWIDKLYLGWLLRIISNPKAYLPRYLSAVKLIFLMIKFKEKKVV